MLITVSYGKAFSPKLAMKANFTYLRGTDWYATNYDDKLELDSIEKLTTMVSTCMEMKLLQTSETYRMVY
jgi:hypothetical protein